MAHHETVEQNLVRFEAGVRHLQRPEHQAMDGLLVCLAGDHFDDAPDEREAGVAIRKQIARRSDLRQLMHASDVACERVVTPAGIHEIITDESGGVRQQMAQSDFRSDLGICEAQLRQILVNRRLQIEAARFDQSHNRGGSECLGDGADLEQCVCVNGYRIVDAGDADSGCFLHTVAAQNANGHAGHVQSSHRLVDNIVECSLALLDHGSPV